MDTLKSLNQLNHLLFLVTAPGPPYGVKYEILAPSEDEKDDTRSVRISWQVSHLNVQCRYSSLVLVGMQGFFL